MRVGVEIAKGDTPRLSPVLPCETARGQAESLKVGEYHRLNRSAPPSSVAPTVRAHQCENAAKVVVCVQILGANCNDSVGDQSANRRRLPSGECSLVYAVDVELPGIIGREKKWNNPPTAEAIRCGRCRPDDGCARGDILAHSLANVVLVLGDPVAGREHAVKAAEASRAA